MNSENPRALTLEEALVSLDEICRRGHLPRLNSNPTVGLAKLTASLQTNLRSLENLENLLLLAVEGFGNLPNLAFAEGWVKRIHITKKGGYRKRKLFKRMHNLDSFQELFLLPRLELFRGST